MARPLFGGTATGQSHNAGVNGEGDANTRSFGERRRLADYSTQYLEDLVTEFQALRLEVDETDAGVKKAVDLIEATLKKSRLSWADLFVIERAILRIQPADRLRRRVWTMRDKYRVVIGEQAYGIYEQSKPPDPADPASTEQQIRSDLDQLLAEFHWLYLTTPVREKVRSHLSKQIAVCMFAAMLIVLGATVYDYAAQQHSNISSFFMILFMGAIGAFLSLQHRIQSLPSSGDPIINILSLRNGWVSIVLSPISGAVFAFIVFLAFSAGLLQGSVFPRMGMADQSTAPQEQRAAAADGLAGANPQASRTLGFSQFLWASIPRDFRNMAVLLVWCFIAGFAERLLPDTLDRMIVRKISVLVPEPGTNFTTMPAPPADRTGNQSHVRNGRTNPESNTETSAQPSSRTS
jgi:hypothetical protein